MLRIRNEMGTASVRDDPRMIRDLLKEHFARGPNQPCQPKSEGLRPLVRR